MDTTSSSDIEQSPPLRTLEQIVFLQVLRTAGVLQHGIAEGLKPYGITTTQYNALRILRGAGPSGLCRNEIRARMLTAVPDATRLLDRLIGSGYAMKSKNPEDNRYVTVRITNKGLAFLAKLDEPVADMHRMQLGHLDESELNQLAHLLETARKGS